MAVFQDEVGGRPFSERAGIAMSVFGAAASLALMVGIGVWGYQLIVRDVSGIPVVRAMEGDMRVAPQDPGGNVALHAGLSVNAVAAVGEAAGPEDRLALAPATEGLSEEDLLVQPLAEEDEIRAIVQEAPQEEETPTALEVEPQTRDTPLSTDDILALADQIAGTAAPLTALEEAPIGTDPAAEVAAVAPPVAPSVPGVAVSMRPSVRPAGLAPVPSTSQTPQTDGAAINAALADALAPAAADTPAAEAIALSIAPIPAGTNLVQLGAYPSPEKAAEEWEALATRFDAYMTGRERIIQEATSGGRTFYRLRAMGFADLGDARRFCAALMADSADCIPVVVR